MVGLNPDTIDYVGVASTNVSGETSEAESTVSGINCSVQENSHNYKTYVNGSGIVYSYCILLTDSVERDKLPVFDIDDKIVYNSKEFKILSFQDLQVHTEIYV